VAHSSDAWHVYFTDAFGIRGFSEYRRAYQIWTQAERRVELHRHREAIFSFAMVVGWTVAVITLFQHKRIFPSLFVFLLAATFALSLADVIVVSQVLNQKIDSASIRDVTRPFLSLIIWGPYMYMSRRVKNTFIH
jgi:predicted ATP-grasp superfamily ATP-dependent carboligase